MTLFWNNSYTCLLYIKREQEGLNTDLHDLLISNILNTHFKLKNLSPTPNTKLGRWLLRSGYFLAAYALYLSRVRKSKGLLDYFANLFEAFELKVGRDELTWYFSRATTKSSKSEGKSVLC